MIELMMTIAMFFLILFISLILLPAFVLGVLLVFVITYQNSHHGKSHRVYKREVVLHP